MPATIPGQTPLWIPGRKPLGHGGSALAIDWGHPLARGLTGLWLMNEVNPARAMNLVNGAVPTSATAVTTSRPWPAGGAAMTFNGTTSVIEIDHHPLIVASTPMTVAAIVLTTSIAAGGARIVHMGADTGSGGWEFGRSGALLEFVKFPGVDVIGTATTNLTANQWFFVSYAVNAANTSARFGRRNLSIVGAFASQTVASTSIANDGSTRSIALGAGRAGGTTLVSFWTGSISLVAVWNDRELSDRELQGLSYDPYALVRPSGWVVLAQPPPAAGGAVTVDLSGLPATATGSAVAPSVVRSSLALDLSASPALATSSAIAPTVVTGFPSITVDLSGAPAIATSSAVAPSSIAGSLTLAPGVATATTSAIAPSIVAGSLAITPAAAQATATAIAPSVVIAGGGTSVNLSGLPASASATAIAPSVIAGSLSLAPAAALASTSAIAPSVVRGSVTVPPAAAIATTAAVAPTVVLGGLTISLAAVPAVASSSAIAPTVDEGGGTIVTLSGAPAIVTATAIAPSVVLGSVSVAPDVAEALASASAPSVILGSVTVNLAGDPAVATTSAVAPIVPVDVEPHIGRLVTTIMPARGPRAGVVAVAGARATIVAVPMPVVRLDPVATLAATITAVPGRHATITEDLYGD